MFIERLAMKNNAKGFSITFTFSDKGECENVKSEKWETNSLITNNAIREAIEQFQSSIYVALMSYHVREARNAKRSNRSKAEADSV